MPDPVAPRQPAPDLTGCDREPIHIPGAIQPHGCLVAVSLANWTVAHASANAPAMFGRDTVDQLLGQALDVLLSAKTAHDLRNILQTSMASGAAERLLGIEIPGSSGRHDLAIHIVDGLVIIEATPRLDTETAVADPITLVKGMIGRLKRAPTLKRFLDLAAHQVRAVTGFDRVMIYRFLEDGTGQVVSESLRGGLSPYLGLHYPASDIPAQARALYRRQWLRLIADVDYQPSPVLPERTRDGAPLDLSLATLRSVSPIHIEYLHNMGAKATLTVSLMAGDALWGLIACHHEAPRQLPASTTAAAEMFGQIFSLQIEARQQQEEYAGAAQAREALDALVSSMPPEETLFDNLPVYADGLNAIIRSDGIGVWTGGKFHGVGVTPPLKALPDLMAMLDREAVSKPYATSALSGVLPAALNYADRVSGLLAIPFPRSPREYLIFFRREVVQTVTWGGDPRKPVQVIGAGERLSPRTSFEAWKEIRRGHAEPWRASDLQLAEALRISLLGVILRRADLLDRERRSAQESQTLLIAELNHRVKNILALIRSVVRQSRQGAKSVEAFTADLEHRIGALAIAHDQITQASWSAAPLRRLLEAEAQAWTPNAPERLILEGPPVLLEARAYQSLALVFHEMMTNAAKYGALSQAGGRVRVAWTVRTDGALEISWRESGGPAVNAPSRRGFGSVVTQQTIPFELHGEARIEFLLEGVRARFVIPGEHVSTAAPQEEPVPARLASPRAALDIRGKQLLLVEDSMMIALDAQSMLQDAGADVEVVGTVRDAERALSLGRFDAAILDVNLTTETSFGLADTLGSREVPFVFATGYGERIRIPERFEGVRVISKPYEQAALVEALGQD